MFRKGNPGRAIPFAKAAELAIKRGGKFDGHELPKELNAMTKASATALAGLGLMGVARDNLPRDWQTYSFQAAFIEIEVDVETGVYAIKDYLGVADVGTVIHPRALGGQIHGGAVQGFGHVRSQKLVYDPHYGAALSTGCTTTSRRRCSTFPWISRCGGRPSSCPTRPTRSVP